VTSSSSPTCTPYTHNHTHTHKKKNTNHLGIFLAFPQFHSYITSHPFDASSMHAVLLAKKPWIMHGVCARGATGQSARAPAAAFVKSPWPLPRSDLIDLDLTHPAATPMHQDQEAVMTLVTCTHACIKLCGRRE